MTGQKSSTPILVTGATGFAGQHLLDRLAGRPSVVAWTRSSGRPEESRALAGIEWETIDLLDRHSVQQAIARRRPSRIYHLAGVSRVDTSWHSAMPHLETNVRGTHNLLDAVRRAGHDCRVLVVSSGMIYQASDRAITEEAPPKPSSPYGLSKLAQDQLALRACAEDGLDIVVARPFNHAGPRQQPAFVVSHFARQIALIEAGRAEPEIQVGNLDARRDLTDVRDVVEAYESLMVDAKTGRPYNVCSGQAPRIGDLLDGLLRLTRARVRVRVDSSLFRPNDVSIVLGDPARIQREVGWSPRVSLDQLLLDTLEWWRAQTTS